MQKQKMRNGVISRKCSSLSLEHKSLGVYIGREGIYVRVSGFMKSFGSKKYINASYMRPIKDFNEVAFHCAECITVSLTLQRGPVRTSSISLVIRDVDRCDSTTTLAPPSRKLSVVALQLTNSIIIPWTLGMNTLIYHHCSNRLSDSSFPRMRRMAYMSV